ncbi:MAG: hypothetical protein COX78_02400 [Candidatus Levybacteria bacterium CG_4_10_14_0_2_um_filter_35_8]|nr:MAG: hypothetical protein COX78_02400 [Candidatus Levybacteria bacterium CG_4_10_14_0_2_um_filter_35_8]
MTVLQRLLVGFQRQLRLTRYQSLSWDNLHSHLLTKEKQTYIHKAGNMYFLYMTEMYTIFIFLLM